MAASAAIPGLATRSRSDLIQHGLNVGFLKSVKRCSWLIGRRKVYTSGPLDDRLQRPVSLRELDDASAPEELVVRTQGGMIQSSLKRKDVDKAQNLTFLDRPGDGLQGMEASELHQTAG